MPPAAWLSRGAARRLVKLLAIQTRHRLHREQILDLLWPEVGVDSALNRFAKALHAARRALEPTLSARMESTYLKLTDDVLTLDAAHVWVDVDEFEKAARTAIVTDDLHDLAGARSLYRGRLLPEDEYEEWTFGRREELARLHEQVLEALARNAQRRRTWWLAADVWHELIALDPTRESAHRELMRLYAARGERAQAVRQYEELRSVLATELQTAPDPVTEAFYRELRAGVKAGTGESAAVPNLAPLPLAVHAHIAGPLVGRAAESRALESALDSAAGGNGRTVLLTGEAGVGKTRLLAEIASRARQRGALVLWGTAYADGGGPTFGPFVEALEGYLATLPQSDRTAIAAQFPVLARLLPSLAPSDTTPPISMEPAIYFGRLFAAFAAVMTEASRRWPLVLIVDDVHSADDTSIRLFQYLARLARNHAWLVIGALRSEELALAGCPARVLLHEAGGEQRERITVTRLQCSDTQALLCSLLGGPVDGRLVDDVFALARGNPRFTHEVVQMLRDGGRIVWSKGGWMCLPVEQWEPPASIRRFAGEILDRFGPRSRLVLELASLLGTEWCPRRLLAVAAVAFPTADQESILDTLDRALAAGLVEDRGDVYTFAQPLVQAAIREVVTTHRAAQFHAAVETANLLS